MNVDMIVNDVKGAVEPYVAKGQDAVTLSFETIKQANTIVFDGVQDLFRTNLDAGKGLYTAAQSSYEKIRADGVKAVVSKPVAYVPEGRELVVGACKQSLTIVTKAGEELYGVARKGLGDLGAKLTGSTTVSGEVKKAKATVRKTAKKASATAKKVADAE